MYTDNSLILFGPHKFTALCRVPAKYLLHLLKHRDNANEVKDDALIEYIEKNIDKIKERYEGKVRSPSLVFCNKFLYLTEKEAKKALNKIIDSVSLDKLHKRPIRTYECNRCGGWHLTAMSIEEFNNKNI